jgi:hypothetical protein
MLRVFTRIAVSRPAALAQTSMADWIAEAAHRRAVCRLLEAFARVTLYTSALDLASAYVFISRIQQTMQHPVHYSRAACR